MGDVKFACAELMSSDCNASLNPAAAGVPDVVVTAYLNIDIFNKKRSINSEVWRRDEPSQDEIYSDNDNGMRLRSTKLPRKKIAGAISFFCPRLRLSLAQIPILQRFSSALLSSEASKAKPVDMLV